MLKRNDENKIIYHKKNSDLKDDIERYLQDIKKMLEMIYCISATCRDNFLGKKEDYFLELIVEPVLMGHQLVGHFLQTLLSYSDKC